MESTLTTASSSEVLLAKNTVTPTREEQNNSNLNSSLNSSDLPTTVDLASFWLKMCMGSLTTLTAQLGYQAEWKKSVISDKYSVSRLKLSVPHTKGKESSLSTAVTNFYPTPTASSGTWESLQLTKFHKISQTVTQGIWHGRFVGQSGIQRVAYGHGRVPESVKKCLEIIGNGVVYDVGLFIGKSLNNT